MGKGALQDIERLRLRRYYDKGPGAKRAPAKPTVEQLRAKVAAVPAKKVKKKKRRTPPCVKSHVKSQRNAQ